MAEFKKWISYLYAYNGEVKGKNVGFARVEARDGRCRLMIGIKGAYGCDPKGLSVGLYIRRDGRPQRICVGMMRIREGSGEWTEVTGEDNLFGTGVKLGNCGGLWLCCEGKDTFYLTTWEKTCLDVREFLPQAEAAVSQEPTGQTVRSQTISPQRLEEQMTGRQMAGTQMTRDQPMQDFLLEELPQPSLWESLYRYYPKVSPELREQGIELLQIRPADIRYLPRRLWYYGSNSFLLHGYYHYKYLVLGRICEQEGQTYVLGVPGIQNDRERASADMFGFHHFLPLQGQNGYWITQIAL